MTIWSGAIGLSGKTLKGLGYKEASHFLRNIGPEFRHLDKHVYEVGGTKIIADQSHQIRARVSNVEND